MLLPLGTPVKFKAGRGSTSATVVGYRKSGTEYKLRTKKGSVVSKPLADVEEVTPK